MCVRTPLRSEHPFGSSLMDLKLVDDDVLHLLCYQSRKTEIASKTASGGLVLVAHTTREWAKLHAQRGGKDERLLKEVAACVQKLIGLEGPLSKLTSVSKVITWKQSQVERPVSSEGPYMVVSHRVDLLQQRVWQLCSRKQARRLLMSLQMFLKGLGKKAKAKAEKAAKAKAARTDTSMTPGITTVAGTERTQRVEKAERVQRASVEKDKVAMVAMEGMAGTHTAESRESGAISQRAEAKSDGTQEMAAGLLPVEAPKALEPVANGFQSAGLHCCAGLLSAPRRGTGLALTLGADPTLDSSHRVLGPVLSGHRCFRRLEVLAPLSLEARPRVPVFLQLPKTEEEASRPVGLRVEPYKESTAPPFSEEADPADLPPEELIDLVDLELSGRDGEVADLKQTTFSRERQQGVDKVEEALNDLLQRLKNLNSLDDKMSGQRVWVEEGANRLLRVLKKLH
eukprot:s2051_g4.t1